MPHTLARPNLIPYIAGFLMVAMALFGPIVQPEGYHHFADTRTLFGIPNAGDVLSNLGFLLAGLYGLLMWQRSPHDTPARTEYGVFFAALALTAAGSTWYHLAPDNARLVWDRLPIALACGALLAAELRRAYPQARAALPALLAIAVASVAWWSYSADLRPYLLVQVAPLLLIPVLHWQTRAAMDRRTAFVLAIVLYVVAKMFEIADGAAFNALGAVSGHTLKHVLAFAAAFVLVRQYSAKN
jgi:hypothetical protein